MATDDDVPISEAEAARIAGLAHSTFARFRREGLGPQHIRLGRLVRYLRPVVIAWRNAQGGKAKGTPSSRKPAHRKKLPPHNG